MVALCQPGQYQWLIGRIDSRVELNNKQGENKSEQRAEDRDISLFYLHKISRCNFDEITGRNLGLKK